LSAEAVTLTKNFLPADTMTTTETRIRSRWREAGHLQPSIVASRLVREIRSSTDSSVTITRQGDGVSQGLYSGSDISNTSLDFQGDWRSLNSMHQFDLFRVRNRSRQLEKGNPWCIAFKRNMLNNVLGALGFHFESLVETGKQFGDASDGVEDETANGQLESNYVVQGDAKNLTTRKILYRPDLDRLLLSRLIFDGEFILKKERGFPANDYSFAWMPLNPDYLDHNLNRIAENGNPIRMGVELDRQYKFPVAYWFWRRRPNDNYFNYNEFDQQLYRRVKAEEIIHVFVQTEDEEQVRGFPWPFAAVINLFRSGKFEEAALVNATIGARQGVFFKKKYPEGFIEQGGDINELNDDGSITMDLPEGSAWELPYGVEPEVVNMRYPDADFGPFQNAMRLSFSAVFGTSYATTTGDLSQANFVSSRMGQIEEREWYMAVQEFMIRHWKKPGFDEELYRSMLAGKVRLPIAKFDKFNRPDFTGRRWKFVQPVDDMTANEKKVNLRIASVGDIIRETSQENPRTVWKRIAKDEAAMKALNIERIITGVATSEASVMEPPPDGTIPKDEPAATL
jgi:lambda family phage portal protein